MAQPMGRIESTQDAQRSTLRHLSWRLPRTGQRHSHAQAAEAEAHRQPAHNPDTFWMINMTLEEKWNCLTPYEQEVVAFTCQGYTFQQIAIRFGINTISVYKYATQAVHKFNAISMLELCLLLSDWNFTILVDPVFNNPFPHQPFIPGFHRKALP